MKFPIYRPRRLRRNEKMRDLVRETALSPKDFIYPLFVCPGKDRVDPVSSMPGVAQLSVDRVVKECKEVQCRQRQPYLKDLSHPHRESRRCDLHELEYGHQLCQILSR